MTKAKLLICPYCGDTQPQRERCRACGGLFEPLSRLATHNAMGPWFIRDPARPFQPGCSYDTMVQLVERGRVTQYTIIRGPTTRQFWTIARRVPGVAHLFGVCHECGSKADVHDHQCPACSVVFGASLERNELGLPEIRTLPWTPAPPNGHTKETANVSQREDDAEELKGRISAFATNGQLLGLTPPDGPEFRLPALGLGDPDGNGPPADTESSDPPNADSAPARAGSRGAGPPDALERSLRRRVESQQRTIRALGILAVGLVVAALVLLIEGRIARTESPTAPTPMQSTAAATEADVLSPQQIELAIAKALALAADADDEQWPLEQRIADLESAMETLARVRRAAGAVPPAGLDENIDMLRLQRDRLRLREFFP
jgi:hypothetical protein